MKCILAAIFAIAAGISLQSASAQESAKAKTTLDAIKERGMLSCGVSQGLPGFSTPDDKGNWTGLDVDICRAIAAACSTTRQDQIRPAISQRPVYRLQSGDIDVLSRDTTWTLSRDTSLGQISPA